MYYTVFVFILYNTSLYFPPPQEDWRLIYIIQVIPLPSLSPMLPVMGSAIPAVVDAVPRPGASAAERLAASQESEGQVSIRTISRSQLRQDCVDAPASNPILITQFI